jgi:hypothetical protein
LISWISSKSSESSQKLEIDDAERREAANIRRMVAAGQSATVGEVAAPNDQVRAFVDYVRLADGTTWGDAATDDAKEISTRFQQQ